MLIERVQTSHADDIRMSRVCESWSLEDLVEMSEKDMEALLEFYREDGVPTLRKVRGEPEPPIWEFDGSFGWF